MIEIRNFNNINNVKTITRYYQREGKWNYNIHNTSWNFKSNVKYLYGDNLTEYLNFINNFQDGVDYTSLRPEDTNIYFRNSSFPSLQLGRLKEIYPNIRFKRISKKDKINTADVIVTDKEDFDFLEYFYEGVSSGILYKDQNNKDCIILFNYYLDENNWCHGKHNFNENKIKTDLQPFIDFAAQQINTSYKIIYFVQIKENAYQERLEILNKQNIISTEEFVKHLWNYLPNISNEEWGNIEDLLNSKKETDTKLGAQLLSTCNFKSKFCDLAKIFSSNYFNLSGTSSINYIKYLIKYDRSYTYSSANSSAEKCYRNIIKTDLYSEEEKANSINNQLCSITDNIYKLFKQLKDLNVYVAWKRNDGRIDTTPENKERLTKSS